MDSSQLILGIDTATLGGSVCLSQGTGVLASRRGNAHISHSNGLLKDISDVLAEANLSIKDIDLFSAAVGPGSFTGLRIGLATVKGLATTTGRLCVGVPTLQAVAHAAGPSVATVSLLPAGRGELFVQMFSVSESGEVKSLDEPADLSPERTFQRYSSFARLMWAGEGAHLHRKAIEDHAPAANGMWIIGAIETLLARDVATLALMQQRLGQTVGPESLQAIYVRPSDAELKINVITN